MPLETGLYYIENGNDTVGIFYELGSDTARPPIPVFNKADRGAWNIVHLQNGRYKICMNGRCSEDLNSGIVLGEGGWDWAIRPMHNEHMYMFIESIEAGTLGPPRGWTVPKPSEICQVELREYPDIGPSKPQIFRITPAND
ncbi:hypothetical protein AMATHDRAFT_49741 [Amanita thiersii Skay4041]|uniref:Uncharacterized protein n=1 Tax=Amanita thiersii Skay4041 TaxID=703135 RepID=A0A2A9NKH3_9AGAR|nr:hypothetical protein AMATHDRAFT_49741 [Amanita thiersii Skay4041]